MSNPLTKAKILYCSQTPAANKKKGRGGNKHPNWISDRTKIKSKRMYFEEKQFVADVLQERNYICEVTGERGGTLSVHHKNGVANFPHLRFEKTNVVVIKRSIHLLFHNMYGTVNITEDKWNRFIKNKEYARTVV
jgi:hypothetical protein